jgi:hypothetical protein
MIRDVIFVSIIEAFRVFVILCEYRKEAAHCTRFILSGCLKYYVKCLMACLFSILRDVKDLIWAQECLLTTSAIFCTMTMQKGRPTMTEVQQTIVFGSIAPH